MIDEIRAMAESIRIQDRVATIAVDRLDTLSSIPRSKAISGVEHLAAIPVVIDPELPYGTIEARRIDGSAIRSLTLPPPSEPLWSEYDA